MKFHEQYRTALELLPAESREYFKDSLIGTMAHVLWNVCGAIRLEQCLEAALFLVQGFDPNAKPFIVKGGKPCSTLKQ